jgi:hypothetical protein
MSRSPKYRKEVAANIASDYLNARDISAILCIPIVQGDEYPQSTLLRLIKELAYRIDALEGK